MNGSVPGVPSVATLFQASGGVGALPARVRPQWPGARVHEPVSDGDLVAADRDGAVVIPRARIDAVLTAARARDSEEARVRRELRTGARLLDLLSKGSQDHERYSYRRRRGGT